MTGPERANLSDAMDLIIANLDDLRQGQRDMREEMNGWAERFEKQRADDMATIRAEIGVLREEVRPVIEFWHHAADGASFVGKVRRWTLPTGGMAFLGFLIGKVMGWIN